MHLKIFIFVSFLFFNFTAFTALLTVLEFWFQLLKGPVQVFKEDNFKKKKKNQKSFAFNTDFFFFSIYRKRRESKLLSFV